MSHQPRTIDRTSTSPRSQPVILIPPLPRGSISSSAEPPMVSSRTSQYDGRESLQPESQPSPDRPERVCAAPTKPLAASMATEKATAEQARITRTSSPLDG